MAINDADLITHIAAGNQEALRTLYMRYRPRLWRYLWQMLGQNGEWVEEVMQDIFLAVWSAARSYQPAISLSPWIFRIARNMALNAQRSHARRVESHTVSLGDQDHDNQMGSFSFEDRIVSHLDLHDALRRLSSHHREVLELHFFHGFSLDEIASITEVPVGTVKSRLSYARQALLKQLGETREGGKSYR